MKISAEDVEISQEKFSRALSIYLRKIHVVNKRVTTVRFASFLERSDRRYFNGRNQIDRRCLIAKNKEVFSDQDEIVLTEEFSAEFLPVVEENFSKKSCSVQCSSYRIEYFPTDKRLEMTIENEANPKQTIWLRDVLFEKFLLWTKSVLTNPEEQSTLKLIPVETYQNEYQRLKNKYGKFLTENWKESTDPQKHVFEDLGIASYLLVYCRNFSEPIKFVDLGCGNGLLTFILRSEGFQGIGIDLRSRRSWSSFDLSFFHQTLIDPKSEELERFIVDGRYNFLIGNHSDQLTPWIPVVARRCHCDAFLLPCCFYDFSGKKFRSTHQDEKSQYEQYLTFVEKLILSLGFEVHRDKLRIPSTKNISFLIHRTEPSWTKESIRDKILEQFSVDIDLENAEPQVVEKTVKSNFYSIKFSIVEHLFKYLLEQNRTLTMSAAYGILPEDLSKALKNERGGLKSIVLSYRHALKFEPEEKIIRLADPMENSLQCKTNSVAKGSIKSKPCFFHRFHPSGCPLIDDQCAFAHQ